MDARRPASPRMKTSDIKAATMEKVIPEFLQYGALGVLALGFVVLLILFYRADKRSQKYADRLDEAGFDRSQLIKVVVRNSEASAALAAQISEMNKAQDKTALIMEKLESRLDNERCPFIKPKQTN